jgi:3-phosphoglycerate kinase
MKQKAPEITENDDLEVAMKFVFGVTKSSVQRQLMNSYDKFLQEAKASMKLPIDTETQEQLRGSEMGKEYLAMLKNFESDLETGKKQAAQVKNNFKSSTS